MSSLKKATSRPWFWPALLAAAVAVGAIVEWARTPSAPPPASSPAVARPSPPSPVQAPAPTSAPRLAPPGRQPPPLIDAEGPHAHPPPGTEPKVPGTGNRDLDQKTVLDDSARRWSDSVRTVRPEILEQMRAGKLQERERLQQQIAQIEASPPAGGSKADIESQIQKLRDRLFYLDRSIGYLEQVQSGGSPR